MDFLPSQKLADLGKKVPQLNKLINFALIERVGMTQCPDYVFLPMALWAKIHMQLLNSVSKNTFIDVLNYLQCNILACLGTWRYSQNVYKFNSTLLDELIITNIDKPLPINILTRLPEYCIYIDLEDTKLFINSDINDIIGVFVWYDYDLKNNIPELRIDLFRKTGEMLPVIVSLIDGYTVREALEHTSKSYIDQVRALGLLSDAENFELGDFWPEHISKLISVIMYLCSDKPEINNLRQPGNIPSRPKPKKVKGGMTLFPAQGVTIWEVGKDIGKRLCNADVEKLEYAGGTHARPRAHVRRGHWHGYWTGPLKGSRTFILKWLHPMLVGMEKE